jgi:hypothetical protein
LRLHAHLPTIWLVEEDYSDSPKRGGWEMIDIICVT